MSTIKIHNVETNEIIEREMTTNELKQYQLECKANEKFKIEAELKAKKRVQLLERLGITEEEAKLLLS